MSRVLGKAWFLLKTQLRISALALRSETPPPLVGEVLATTVQCSSRALPVPVAATAPPFPEVATLLAKVQLRATRLVSVRSIAPPTVARLFCSVQFSSRSPKHWAMIAPPR